MRAVLIIVGLVLGAVGGVIAYRAAFVAPHTTMVINSSAGTVHQLPHGGPILGGLALLVAGFLVAFLAARRAR